MNIDSVKFFLSLTLTALIGINLNTIAQTTASNVLSHDSRNINSGPSSYSRELKFEFKSRSIIGVPGTGGFSGLLTLAPWVSDGTGNRHHQINFNDGGIYYRNGINNTSSWGTWRNILMENESGNVGIGITTPNHKLEVNGTVRAQGVKVEATDWPDYVFEEGYELMTLEEVKAYIDKNGHLPGLKPAKEYEDEGVDIMELNQKLLEKVEELTLYIIGIELEGEQQKKQHENEILGLREAIMLLQTKQSNR